MVFDALWKSLGIQGSLSLVSSDDKISIYYDEIGQLFFKSTAEGGSLQKWPTGESMMDIESGKITELSYNPETLLGPSDFPEVEGWYQDIDGNLYNWSGSSWDVLPGKKELEFLG